MIVRLATDGQYRLPDSELARLNEIDEQAEAAAQAGDEARFQGLLVQMGELVRGQGEPLDDDELVESDVIVPPPDSTIEQLAGAFEGEGLIPG